MVAVVGGVELACAQMVKVAIAKDRKHAVLRSYIFERLINYEMALP